MLLNAPWGINPAFAELFPTKRQIAYVLRTRSPLDFQCIATQKIPLDLHVLTIPPAFTLNQDQILRKIFKALQSPRTFIGANQAPRFLIWTCAMSAQWAPWLQMF